MFHWFTQSLWRDEAFSYLLAMQPVPELLSKTAIDFNPPLYYLTLKIWVAVFGSSEIMLRSLSLLFAVLTVYIIIDFLTDVVKMKPRNAVGLGILFSFFTPILLYYAFEARMYTMLAFFATASWYALLTHKRRWYVIFSLLGLYTHYFMILNVLTQWIVIWQGWWPHPRRFHKTVVIIIAAYVPWVLYVLTQKPVDSVRHFWIQALPLRDIWQIPTRLLTGYDSSHGFNYVLIPLTLVLIAIIAAPFVLRYKKFHISRFAAIIFLWIALPSVAVFAYSLLFTPIFLPRYLIFCSVAITLCVILSLRRLPALTAIVCATFYILIVGQYQLDQMRLKHKADIRSKIEQVNMQTGKDDELWVESVLDYHTAQYYFKNHDKVYISGETYEDIPSYVGRVLIPPTAVIYDPPYTREQSVYLLSKNQKITLLTTR